MKETVNFREFLRRPGLKVGHGVFEFATTGIGEILVAAGVEFVFLDMEQTAFDMYDIKRLVAYMRAAGLPTMVRGPSLESHDFSRVMDAGADALVVANVDNPEIVRRGLDALKFPPAGKRPVSGQMAHDRYRPGNLAEMIRDTNERTALIVMIETVEGLEKVDEIAAVDGVDCLWIGHYDLSTWLGVPGEFEHPVFLRAQDKIVAAGKRHGRALGRLVHNIEAGEAVYRAGFDTICFGGDIWTYFRAVSEGVSGLKQACADAPARASR